MGFRTEEDIGTASAAINLDSEVRRIVFVLVVVLDPGGRFGAEESAEVPRIEHEHDDEHEHDSPTSESRSNHWPDAYVQSETVH